MNVFFHVLDMLLTDGGVPRPHARDVFHELNQMGHEVYLWSSAGGAYAAAAAEILGVADLVAGGVRQAPRVRSARRLRRGRRLLYRVPRRPPRGALRG